MHLRQRLSSIPIRAHPQPDVMISILKKAFCESDAETSISPRDECIHAEATKHSDVGLQESECFVIDSATHLDHHDVVSDDTPPPIDEPAPPQATSSAQPATSGGMGDNTWCLLSHLSGLVGYLGNGIGGVIAPLIIYLVKKDTSPLIASHAKEALNFNISVAIYALALVLLMIVTFGIGALIAVPGLIALGIFHLVFAIIAAIKANAGIFYRYPLTLRLVK